MIRTKLLTRETIPLIRLDSSRNEGLPASPMNVSAIKPRDLTPAPRMRSHVSSNIFASVLRMIRRKAMTTDFSQFTRIPSLPTVAIEALKLFHDTDSSNEQLVSVIRKDPAMVGKLLKVANSSKYGTRGEITDLGRAVMLIGRSAAAPLILSFSLARQSMENSDHFEHYRRFWLRSFVQATAAEVLASQYESPSFRGECYTTSILAGLGKLALLKAEPVKYLECLRRAKSEGIPLPRKEQEAFGFNHLKLSSILLQQMGLPERCQTAIRGINDPSNAKPEAGGETHPLLEVTRLADAVASLFCDETPAISLIHLEESLAKFMLPKPLSVTEVVEGVQEQIDATAQSFDISPDQLPSTSDLLQDALEEMSRLADLANNENNSQSIPIELLEENGRLKRRVADLLYVSRIDALTGICNRACLLQELSERAALHRVRDWSLGMAVIDIDHFKKINDTYGHQAGDHALKVVAETLRKTIRDSDFVARYAGEEFVVLLEGADAVGLAVVGERLRSEIEQTVFVFEGKTISLTASIGLAEGKVFGSEQEFGHKLFAAADAAMYRAKHSGRNCFVVDSLVQEGDSLRTFERSRSRPEVVMA
jgi:diguanylate cyclase (GGDEF)-like protein